jgi:lysozyme
MNAYDIALERTKVNEGFSAVAYRDTRGFLTIGYGFNVDSGVSQELAQKILEWQLANAQKEIEEYPWFVGCDVVRQSVLVELCFNMGLTKLLGFKKMLAACANNAWETAANELQSSAWYKQVGRRGPALVMLLRSGL